MIAHDLNSLAAVCYRVAALADGKIVALGPLSAVQSALIWLSTTFNSHASHRSHLVEFLADYERDITAFSRIT
jgi:phospholipid/cholesterol/gamma-HCH transport system ATP-binding protein